MLTAVLFQNAGGVILLRKAQEAAHSSDISMTDMHMMCMTIVDLITGTVVVIGPIVLHTNVRIIMLRVQGDPKNVDNTEQRDTIDIGHPICSWST